MPNNHKSVGRVKYSNLITTRQLLSQGGTRTISSYRVVIVGLTGPHINPRIQYASIHYDTQPLKALGRAVAQWFEYYPQGSITHIEVHDIYE